MSAPSPMLGRVSATVSLSLSLSLSFHLQWYQSNQTAPAELDSTQIEKAQVENICPSLCLCKNLGVIVGKAGRNCFFLLFSLFAESSRQTRGWNSLEIRILW